MADVLQEQKRAGSEGSDKKPSRLTSIVDQAIATVIGGGVLAAIPMIVAAIAHPTWQVVVAVEITVVVLLVLDARVFIRVARPLAAKVDALPPEVRTYQKACNMALVSAAIMLSVNIAFCFAFAVLYAVEHV